MALNIWKNEKTVSRVRKKQWNLSSPKYTRNLVLFVDILAEFLKY